MFFFFHFFVIFCSEFSNILQNSNGSLIFIAKIVISSEATRFERAKRGKKRRVTRILNGQVAFFLSTK